MRSIKNIDELQDLYQIYDVISNDNNADIYKAIDIINKKDVVIKNSGKRNALNELNFFRNVLKEPHPNIIYFYTGFEDAGAVYLVLEYANGGDLLDLCTDPRLLSENNIRQIFIQIVEGTKYIHSLGYFHGDLKPENILLIKDLESNDYRVKIIDFEFARSYRNDMLIKCTRGTLNYAAPEILCRDSFIGPEVDMWALGVILYIITFKCPLFSHPNNENASSEIFREIFHNFAKQGFNLSRIISCELHFLLAGLLTVDRKVRFTMNEVVSSTWLQAQNM